MSVVSVTHFPLIKGNVLSFACIFLTNVSAEPLLVIFQIPQQVLFHLRLDFPDPISAHSDRIPVLLPGHTALKSFEYCKNQQDSESTTEAYWKFYSWIRLSFPFPFIPLKHSPETGWKSLLQYQQKIRELHCETLVGALFDPLLANKNTQDAV